MGIVSGCIAGVCGLTGLSGLGACRMGRLVLCCFPFWFGSSFVLCLNLSYFYFCRFFKTNSMLPSPAYYSFTLYPSYENEIQFAFLLHIKVAINYIVFVDGSAKMRIVVHVILDSILWVSIFILRTRCNINGLFQKKACSAFFVHFMR